MRIYCSVLLGHTWRCYYCIDSLPNHALSLLLTHSNIYSGMTSSGSCYYQMVICLNMSYTSPLHHWHIGPLCFSYYSLSIGNTYSLWWPDCPDTPPLTTPWPVGLHNHSCSLITLVWLLRRSVCIWIYTLGSLSHLCLLLFDSIFQFHITLLLLLFWYFQ